MPADGASAHPSRSLTRQNQRRRRAVILAAIRQLLMEEGYRGITVRRVAELSGHVVQTVYNLAGPRGHAIVEAVLDYTLHIGRLAPPSRADDPAAIIRNIEWQGQSVALAPDFTRQFCMIHFTEDRHIFQEYRNRQVRNVQALLARQKRAGILRRDVHCRELAQELMMYSSVLFTDWADSSYPVDELIQRFKSGYAHILAGTISPRFGGLAAMPI